MFIILESFKNLLCWMWAIIKMNVTLFATLKIKKTIINCSYLQKRGHFVPQDLHDSVS